MSLRAAGINPTETYARAGKYTGCRTISVPFTPGGQGRSDPVSQVSKSLGSPLTEGPPPRQSVSVYGYRIYTKETKIGEKISKV